jgi:transposase
VHRAAAVKRGLDRHPDRLRLFFWPGYSPELNPDEYLNQDVKTNALGRQRPPDQPTMMRNVRSYLWSTQRQPEIVQSYFHHKSATYAAL